MRNKGIYHLFLLAALGLIAYSNVFNAPFVFDDLNAETGIARNPVIKDLDNFISGFKGYEYNPRRFVGYLTFALNYYVGGLEVTGYHIVNLAIHIITTVLVYFLVLLTFKTPFFRGPGTRDRGSEAGNQIFAESPVTSHQSRITAFIVALLFVSHPIQTQAVTYIVQRFTSLATLFYLLSLVMYIKGRLTAVSDQPHPPQPPLAKGGIKEGSSFPLSKGGSRGVLFLCYFLSLLSAVLAMKTKEIAFTLPVMILIYEFSFFKSTLKRRLLLLIPVLLTLLIIMISVFHIDKPLGETLSELSEKARVQTDMARGDYLMTEMRVIVTYLRLIFFPINQNLYYDYPIYNSLFTPEVSLSFLFLAAIFGLAVYLIYRSRQADKLTSDQAISDNPLSPPLPRGEVKGSDFDYSLFTIHYSRLAAFGIFWFFIALSVESSVVPIEDVIFEHRLYLPSVGAFIAIAAFLSFIAGKAKSRPQIGKAVIPGFVALIVALTAATWNRNTVWQDEVTLMEDVALKSPGNAKVRNGLGHVYMTKGWNDKAIEQLLIAIALSPDYARARNNLGVAYGKKGMLDKALVELSYALSLEPRNPEIYNNIGVLYRAKGDTSREMTYFQAALEFDPNLAVTHYNLGKAYAARDWKEKADEHFKKAHELAPDTY